MRTKTFFTALITLALPLSGFAQCFNTEEQFIQKARDMAEQCSKMIAIVPCAVGFSDYPYEDEVMTQADIDALTQLAINVDFFIKFHSTDSTYISEEITSRLKETVKKVNVKQRLTNTRSVARECVPFTKNGKPSYKGASLRVLDPTLYKEALEELKKLEKEEAVQVSSSSQVVSAVSSSSSVQTLDNEINEIKEVATPKADLPKKDSKLNAIFKAAKKYAPMAGKAIFKALTGVSIP